MTKMNKEQYWKYLYENECVKNKSIEARQVEHVEEMNKMYKYLANLSKRIAAKAQYFENFEDLYEKEEMIDAIYVERIEKINDELQDEVNKSGNIIDMLQAELKTQKTKIKMLEAALECPSEEMKKQIESLKAYEAQHR